jgi:DNA gyrase subunit A
MEAVQSKDDLMLITANGMIIRTGLDQIRSIGRNTQGVRLIKLKPGDKLVAGEKITPESDKTETTAKSDSSRDDESGSSPSDKADPEPQAEAEAKSESAGKRTGEDSSAAKTDPRKKRRKSK